MIFLWNLVDRASQGSPAIFVGDVVARARGNRHDGKCGLIAALRHEHCAVRDENVFQVVELAEAVDDTLSGILAHSRGAAFMDVFAKNAETFSGRLAVLELHNVENPPAPSRVKWSMR